MRLIAEAGLDAEVWGFARAVARRRRGARRARRARDGDRVAAQRPEARRDRRLPREDARPDRRRRLVRRGRRDHRRVLRRRRHARRPGVPRAGLPRRGRGRRARGRGRRHARRRHARGGRRPRRHARATWVGPDVPVHFHGHNDFGLATASAVAAVRAGATWIHGTVNGMGERAGNANIGEIALALRALYGVETRLRLDRFRALSERVRELSGYDARAVEAARRREPLPARERRGREPVPRPAVDRAVLVRARRRRRAGSCSARRAASTRSGSRPRSSGSSSTRTRAATLLAAVKELGERERRLVGDDEFRALAAARLARGPAAARARDSKAPSCGAIGTKLAQFRAPFVRIFRIA